MLAANHTPDIACMARASVEAVVTVDRRLHEARSGHLEHSSRRTDQSLATAFADLVDVLCFTAVAFESLIDAQSSDLADIGRPDVSRRIHARSGMDLKDAMAVLQRLGLDKHHADDHSCHEGEDFIVDGARFDDILKVVHLAVEGAPRLIKERSDGDVQLRLLHRVQTASQRLRALLHRTANSAQTKVLGDAFADGRLSVAEVAAGWGMQIPDAVAILEEHGFARSIERIRLTPERRAAARARLAAAMSSGHGYTFDPERLRQDVIATQRIEGVDVRSWMPTTDGLV